MAEVRWGTDSRSKGSLQVVAGVAVLGLGLGSLAFAVLGGGDADPSDARAVVTEAVQGMGEATPPAPTTPPGSTAAPTGRPTPTKSPKAPKRTQGSGTPATSQSRKATPAADPQPKKTRKTEEKKETKQPKVASPSVNLAAAGTVQESSHTQEYVAANVTDGSTSTYWEGTAGFPQTLTVDLGRQQTVGRFVLSLPPVPDWNSRTQTIALSGSRNGSSYQPLEGAKGYSFDANSSAGNTVSIPTAQTRVRYLRLTFTANTGWNAAQLSELSVHSS